MAQCAEVLDLQCSKQKEPSLGSCRPQSRVLFENFDDIRYCSRRICSKQISALRPHILRVLLCFSGTHGTSAFLLTGSGVDSSFPNMSFAAFPPHALVAPRCYPFWCQRAIQRIVPLSCNFRVERCKIVETSQNAPSCAVWAAGVLYSSCSNNGLPFMPKCALPPDLSVAEGSNLIRSQASVAFRVPLCGDVRKERRQIILAGHHGLPRANRASRAPASAQNTCPPRMTFIAFPPDASFASCQHIIGF